MGRSGPRRPSGAPLVRMTVEDKHSSEVALPGAGTAHTLHCGLAESQRRLLVRIQRQVGWASISDKEEPGDGRGPGGGHCGEEGREQNILEMCIQQVRSTLEEAWTEGGAVNAQVEGIKVGGR